MTTTDRETRIAVEAVHVTRAHDRQGLSSTPEELAATVLARVDAVDQQSRSRLLSQYEQGRLSIDEYRDAVSALEARR